jgi:hypothetical protein
MMIEEQNWETKQGTKRCIREPHQIGNAIEKNSMQTIGK